MESCISKLKEKEDRIYRWCIFEGDLSIYAHENYTFRIPCKQPVYAMTHHYKTYALVHARAHTYTRARDRTHLILEINVLSSDDADDVDQKKQQLPGSQHRSPGE